MGRPSQIHDEDIDTELPSDVVGFPPSESLCAHLSLSRIMGEISSQVFRIRRMRKEDIGDVISHLRQWKEDLPASLTIREGETISCSRSVLLLHLSYNQVTCYSLLLIAVNSCHLSNYNSGLYHHPSRLYFQSQSRKASLYVVSPSHCKHSSSPSQYPTLSLPRSPFALYFSLISFSLFRGDSRCGASLPSKRNYDLR
jgi:hypothetical protein